MTGHHSGRVTPFGNPRISGCVLLPTAFRSLPRPSSPDSSKASTMNPYSLDHIFSLHHARAPQTYSRTHVLLSLSLASIPDSVKEQSVRPDIRAGQPILAPAYATGSTIELEVRGFEPLTYGLQSHRSSQLSYTPDAKSQNNDPSENSNAPLFGTASTKHRFPTRIHINSNLRT